MQALELAEFDEQSAHFDALVARTPDIDHFCTSTDWIIPAATALMPTRSPWLFRGESCQVAMMRARHPDGWNYIEPLESMWGLACPVVGSDVAGAASEFCELLARRKRHWNVCVLSGVPEQSPLLDALLQHLSPRYRLLQGPTTRRCVASLDGGVDGFLGRRSRNFRKALRRARRSAEDAGIEFVSCRAESDEQAAALYQRAVAVELRSWKGQAGVGIESGHMHRFYRAMVPRLARRDALELMFARDPRRADRPGESGDIGFVLGGLFESPHGTTYRGLQFSFDNEYGAMALGNLCQYHQIVELCRDGIGRYDLGTDMEYKQRWAELRHDTVGLIVMSR